MTSTPTPEPQGWDILTAEQRQRVVLARESRSLVHVSAGGSSAVDAGALLAVTDWLMNGDTAPDDDEPTSNPQIKAVQWLAANPDEVAAANMSIDISSDGRITLLGSDVEKAGEHRHTALGYCQWRDEEQDGPLTIVRIRGTFSPCEDVCRCGAPLQAGELIPCRSCEVGDDEALPVDQEVE